MESLKKTISLEIWDKEDNKTILNRYSLGGEGDMDDTVKEIRQYRNFKRLMKSAFPTLLLCAWISPYVSSFAVKKKITPNQLTLLMFPSSILASALLLFNPWYIKIIGALFVHFWYTLDLSDGQVARYTKNYSKYGQELDCLAHHFCHSFLIVAFCVNLYQIRNYDVRLILLVCSGMFFAEYSFRDICSIAILFNRKAQCNECVRDIDKKSKKNVFLIIKLIIKFIVNLLHSLDNYVLLGSILMFVDIFFHTDVLLYLSICFIIGSLLNNAYITFYLTKKAMEY